MRYNWIFDLDYTLYQYHCTDKKFDYSKLESDPNLKDKIKKLPGKKFLYTNANLWHTVDCVKQLKIEKTFHKISCRELSDFKPRTKSFDKFIKLVRLIPEDICFFFEDNLDNLIKAKKYNWITIYVGENKKDLFYARQNPDLIDYTFPDISEALRYFNYNMVVSNDIS